MGDCARARATEISATDPIIVKSNLMLRQCVIALLTTQDLL